jgi:hypothetical protein
MIRHRMVRTGAALAAGIAIGLSVSAIPAIASTTASAGYTFRKLDNGADGTFNELLGINNHRKIVGFYGSGVHGDPNQGYSVVAPYGQFDYAPVDYPGAAQTEVTGLNDNGVLVGTYSRTNKLSGANTWFGFYAKNGRYHKVAFPTGNNAVPSFNELVSINIAGVAVGDFTDAAGNPHGYRYNINTHKYAKIAVNGLGSLTATAINARGTVVGYFTNASGKVVSFLRRGNGQVVTISKPGADETQAFGINAGGEIVGAYTIGNNSYGFTWLGGRFSTVSDPNGIGRTVVNGVNNAGDLVGFYTDKNGNTNGMLATP